MTNKVIFGVCAKVADLFGWDVKYVRIIWAVVALLWGVGIGLYLILAIVFWLRDRV